MTLVFLAAASRLDWGFGNPNKTAALIVSLILTCWALPRLVPAPHRRLREAGVWLAFALSVALGAALLLTGSRGGVVAAGAGLAILIAGTKRPWATRRVLGAALALPAAALTAGSAGALARMAPAHAATDASIGNRLLIWKSVPVMMADAPAGWGVGNSGAAYMQWYQPTDRFEEYRTLVSSHLTWLVEFGTAGRCAYVGAWALALLIAWPRGGFSRTGARAGAWPLAVLVAFFVTAAFSSVAESGALWVAPGLALAFAATDRLRHREWPGTRRMLLTLAGALAAPVAVVLAAGGRTGIRTPDGGATVFFGPRNTMPALIFALGADAKESPRRLRDLAQAGGRPPALVWTRAPERLSAPAGTPVVLLGSPEPGRVKPLVLAARRTLALAPAYGPDALFDGPPPDTVLAIHGDFSAAPAAGRWKAAGRHESIPGMADFIADWPDRSLALVSPESTSR